VVSRSRRRCVGSAELKTNTNEHVLVLRRRSLPAAAELFTSRLGSSFHSYSCDVTFFNSQFFRVIRRMFTSCMLLKFCC